MVGSDGGILVLAPFVGNLAGGGAVCECVIGGAACGCVAFGTMPPSPGSDGVVSEVASVDFGLDGNGAVCDCVTSVAFSCWPNNMMTFN